MIRRITPETKLVYLRILISNFSICRYNSIRTTYANNIKGPYLMRIFTMKYFIEVGSIIAVVSVFNQIFSSVYNYYKSNLESSMSSYLPYLYDFIGSTVLNLIGIIFDTIIRLMTF